MSEMSCEEIRDLLVDFADDELDDVQAESVSLHVSACEECRSELQRLRRSLALARSAWEGLAGEHAVSTTRATTRRAFRYVAGFAAAGLLIAVGIWQLGVRPEERRGEVVQVPETAVPVDDAGIERAIRREERAARLAALMNILLAEQGLEREGRQVKKDLLTRYSDTMAARELSE